MQTEKHREILVGLITEFENNEIVRCPKYDEPTCDGCEYDSGAECDKPSILADYLIANGVTVEIKQEEMTKILLSLFQFAKSIQSEKVELQKDEYLYLLEYMEKAENALKERNNEN